MEVTTKVYLVDGWRIEPLLNRMTKNDRVVQLEPRIMHVLVCLLEHGGEVVTRDTLMATVWADTYVGEDPLNRAVSELRKIFGDAARSPRFIETIRKTGYRFIASVECPSEVQTPAVSVGHAKGASTVQGYIRWLIVGAVVVLGIVVLWFGMQQAPRSASFRPQPFTALAGIEYGPVFSNDGTRVAFTWDGPEEENEDIYVKLLNGETVQRLTTNSAIDVRPTWSPDDQQIAFTRIAENACHIMTMSALGGPARQVATCMPSSFVKTTWSPDGNTVIYVSAAVPNGPFQLFAVDMQTLVARSLTTPDSYMHGDTHPAFSPDGTYLAFARTTISGVENLMLMEWASGEVEALTQENQRISGLSWADTQTLLYSSDREGTFSLWRLNRRSSLPEFLLTGGDGAHRPTLANGVLIYEQRQLDKNIWQLPLGEADAQEDGPTQLIASTRWDFSPAYAPDGKRIAFASNRTGTYEIWVTDRFGLDPVQLTQFNGSVVGKPRWSPDGQMIAFDARSEGHSDVYVVALAGGRPQRQTHDPGDDVAPTWSADGRFLYFGSSRSGAWQIWKRAFDGSTAPEQVTSAGGFMAQESLDGERLFFVHEDRDGLWEVADSDREPQLLMPYLQARDWSNWAVQEGGIFYVDRIQSSQIQLAFFDFTEETSQLVHPLGQRTTNPGIAVSPDGRSVLFARIDQYASDLMRVDGFR